MAIAPIRLVCLMKESIKDQQSSNDDAEDGYSGEETIGKFSVPFFNKPIY